VAGLEQATGDVSADEPRAAGDQDSHRRLRLAEGRGMRTRSPP
jgi:hypothetical protein